LIAPTQKALSAAEIQEMQKRDNACHRFILVKIIYEAFRLLNTHNIIGCSLTTRW
jgi:hypothetical protein